jgi:hypothetical protein
MTEAETYARMEKAEHILRLRAMTITANILREAMDAMASDFNTRTNQDLPTLAREFIF